MNNERYLVHHGILGQKWGVRRYQNEDGSLTSAGKARYLTADRKKEISEQYKAESDKFGEELSKNGRRLYDESFNRAVAEMDQFDKQQQRKYGDDYAERPGYLEDGGQYFAKFFATDYNKTIKEFYLTNEHYINAMDLLDKYGMETWDDLARDDLEAISYVFDS